MKPLSSYAEMDALGRNLSDEYNRQTGKKNVKCFDIVGFITDYLNLSIVYETFGEEYASKHVLIDYAISQLVSIKSKMSGGKSEINDIDVQIASLCNQNNMLVQTKAKGIIDDMSFLEMTGSIQKEISKLRDRRLKIIREDDEEGTIEKLREVNAFLEQSPKAIIMFDTVLFKELVSEIISTADYELIFVLKCGLKLKERLK